jgi:hypothetical protein
MLDARHDVVVARTNVPPQAVWFRDLLAKTSEFMGPGMPESARQQRVFTGYPNDELVVAPCAKVLMFAFRDSQYALCNMISR